MKKKLVRYQDLLQITSKENKEKLIAINNEQIKNGYRESFNDMQFVLNGKIYIRQSVLNKLIQAQANLKTVYPSLTLFVTYGYRCLEIQTKHFLRILSNKKQFYSNPFDLYESIHTSIAVPDVSGHPTGGAIDVLIYDVKSESFLNFGSEQYNFSDPKCNTFQANVSRIGTKNRQLLRTILIDQGFAPFDGEWWHFSYGDREWAYYYNKPYAIYKQIQIRDINKFML